VGAARGRNLGRPGQAPMSALWARPATRPTPPWGGWTPAFGAEASSGDELMSYPLLAMNVEALCLMVAGALAFLKYTAALGVWAAPRALRALLRAFWGYL
jgi:hypothetical protein